jgi:hypothetical protein
MAPLLENIRFEALKKLASERFGPITPSEEEVLRLSTTADSSIAEDAKTRSDVRAEFLRWLATDKDAIVHFDPFGFRVANAIILSQLNLDFCRLPFQLLFINCIFRSGFSLNSADVAALRLLDCTTEGPLSCENMHASSDIQLHNLRATGKLNFIGAQVEGALDCSGAHLAAASADGFSLSADGARFVNGICLRDGFESADAIRFVNAQIGGNLDCTGAKLFAAPSAFVADGASISGTVLFRHNFATNGAVRLSGAKISGDLDCSGANNVILTCERAHITGTLFLRGIQKPQFSYANLSGTSTNTLADDSQSWPPHGGLFLNRLEYKVLAHYETATAEELKNLSLPVRCQLNAAERILWLNLQNPNELLDPHAWMWLARFFKDEDDIAGYRKIICEYRCLKARSLKNPVLRWLNLQLAEIERNPWRMFWAFLPLLLLGTAIFWSAAHHIPPTNSEASRSWASGAAYPAAYPRFNPLVYTLENELPLIKFGMDDKWAPDPNLATQHQSGLYWSLAGFRWFLIAAGWIQGILLTVGINRRFRD